MTKMMTLKIFYYNNNQNNNEKIIIKNFKNNQIYFNINFKMHI